MKHPNDRKLSQLKQNPMYGICSFFLMEIDTKLLGKIKNNADG